MARSSGPAAKSRSTLFADRPLPDDIAADDVVIQYRLNLHAGLRFAIAA